MEPLISIIVPIYNREQYLEKCINSILSQTFTNFELILVDDGSQDNSLEICKKFEKTDNRIKVLHKSNGGVSSARNLGISKAKGELICFVDSDDVVNDAYLEHLYRGLNNAELVIGSFLINGKVKMSLKDSTYYGSNAAVYILKNDILALSGPFSKLFKKRIIKDKNITFPKGINMGEDAIFFLKYLIYTNSVSFISSNDYYVNDTPNSLSTKYYSFDSEWTCYILWRDLLTKYVNKYKGAFTNPQKIIERNRVGDTFFRCLFSILEQDISLNEKLKLFYYIPDEDYENLIKYYKPENKRKQILLWEIRYRLFFLFIITNKLKEMKRRIFSKK